jgi:hypothetical protein
VKFNQRYIRDLILGKNLNEKAKEETDEIRKKYKPAFSMGFRGFPRTETPLGRTPAPTIDQVRELEKKYKVKLIVKEGLVYFKYGEELFTHERAKERNAPSRDCNCEGCECEST